MNNRKACEEFLEAFAKVAVTPEKKEYIIRMVESTGLKVDNNLNLLSPTVRQEQLKQIIAELNEMAVLKILARRVFRSNGIDM